MLPDCFLCNAAICAAGFATAIWWLRTGMLVRGVALLVAMAVTVDVALVARFVFADRGGWFQGGLMSMQVAALGSVAALGVALARRRWSADARRRAELFAAGLQHYLRDELKAARNLFLRLRRADPWDVAATVALANVHWREGRAARARTLLQIAARLDRRGEFRDFIGEQLRRVAAAPSGRPHRSPPAELPAEPVAAG